MEVKKVRKTRIKVKKIGIRGDEVAILFFSLVFLAFLFISFFRLFAIGKLFDDFIFLFIFGWSKYLAYLFLFIIILPIFCNYYFRFKFSIILSAFFTLFITSWLVQNISILINSSNNDIWWKTNFYQFGDLSHYFQKWWDATIINNYHGFFAQPISFANWNDMNSFFPNFAAGGIIANFLVYLSAYGGFIMGWILSSVFLFIALSWLFLAKPWLLFTIIFIFVLPIIKYIKKRKINRISEKSLEHKTLLDEQEEKDTITASKFENPIIDEQKFVDSQAEEQKKVTQNVLQESSILTPFGKIKKDETIDLNTKNNNKD